MRLLRSRRTGSIGGPGLRPRRGRRIAIWVAAVLAPLLLIASLAPRLGLLGSAPYVIYPAHGPRLPITAVLMSGDVGFVGGMSAPVGEALARRGMTVVGVSSPVLFARHRTLDESLAIVEQAIRMAMRISGAHRVILVGQSYGADIMATVIPRLSPDLMAHVQVIDLMVPGRNVYFRADPLGLEYLGEPDAHPASGLLAMRGPPMICIWGVEETDSLCPQLKEAATVIGLPGNHHLHHDPARLIAATMGALHQLVPAIGP